MNTSKTSSSLCRIAVVAILFGTLGASTTAFASAKAAKATVKVTAVKTTPQTSGKTVRPKAKLPKQWVWKKYTKNFDSMYRK